MLALGLTLFLLATPEAQPSARLVAEELLSAADVLALDRELRIVSGNIELLKPNVPQGFVIGMALGFSFAVLLLPGIPLLVIGATSSSFAAGTLLFFGAALTGLGGVALGVALLCAVLGTDAESTIADDRARLVERRDALKRRLEPYQPQPGPERTAPGAPGYVPGVQLELPAPRLVTLARF